MQEHNFDKILDYLCSGIMSKSEKQSVRDELYDHLMCKYETNLAIGMNEETASEEAIRALGDKSKLKENLQKVHWYYPTQSLKSAFYLLIIGLMAPLLSVFIGISEFMFELASVISIISIILELVALFTMRTANSEFRTAFKFCILTTSFDVIQKALEPFLKDYLIVTVIISSVCLILDIIKYIYLFKGLKELLKPFGDTKLIRETASLYLMCLVCPFEFLVSFGNNTSAYSRILVLIFAVLTIAFYLLFISSMLKISDILYKSDHEYKVDISVKRRSVVAFGALAFALVTIFSADLVYSNIDINQSRKIYSIEDYEMEQTEYERICENIVSYGVPKKWVSLMPKSEISEYKNAVNKSEMTESAQQLMDYYEENLDGDITSFDFYNGDDYVRQVLDGVSVYNYAVSLGYSENGYQTVRFIKIFFVPTGATKMYKDTVVFDYNVHLNGIYPVASEKAYCGDLLVAVKEEGNLRYKKDIKLLGERENDSIEGFVFDVEPGTVIIYATTRQITNVGSTLCNMNFNYYHQKYPIMFPVRDIEDLFAFSSFTELSTFTTFRYNRSNHYYVMPDYEYVVPKNDD